MFLMWEGICFHIGGPHSADKEGSFPELGSCLHDNSCVDCGGTELSASRFFTAKFDQWPCCWNMPDRVDENSVRHGGDLELNSCLHRQPVKTLQRRLDVCPVIQTKNKPSDHVLHAAEVSTWMPEDSTAQSYNSLICWEPVMSPTVSWLHQSLYPSQLSQPFQMEKNKHLQFYWSVTNWLSRRLRFSSLTLRAS